MVSAKFLEVPQKLFPYLEFEVKPLYNYYKRTYEDTNEIEGYTIIVTGNVGTSKFKRDLYYSLWKLDRISEEELVNSILDLCFIVVKIMSQWI